MTYEAFYEKLTLLSLFAPSDRVRLAVLELQISLDELTSSDDEIGLELNSEFEKLFA